MSRTFEFNLPGLDGTKWGPSDFYPEVHQQLAEAFASGLDWDTGWMGCKKEILSSRFSREGNTVTVQVSVSDDFDTNGVGEAAFSFDQEETVDSFFSKIEKAAGEAHAHALDEQKDNRTYIGFRVGRVLKKGPNAAALPVPWEWTYLYNISGLSSPPGDNYHRWGWQEVPDDADDDDLEAHPEDMPADVADKLAELITDFCCGSLDAAALEYGGYRATPWED